MSLWPEIYILPMAMEITPSAYFVLVLGHRMFIVRHLSTENIAYFITYFEFDCEFAVHLLFGAIQNMQMKILWLYRRLSVTI